MDEVTRRRLAHNEAVFRSVNEEIDERTDARGQREYVCECADTECAATVTLTHEAYAHVRAGERRYFLVPGHELGDLEVVVERHDDYLVVEKR